MVLFVWLFSAAQQYAPHPLGPALDSLLKSKPQHEAINLLFAYRDAGAKQKEWAAFGQYTLKLSKLFEQNREYERADSLLTASMGILEGRNTPDTTLAKIYLQAGYVKRMQEKWTEALSQYKKSIQTFESTDYRGPFYGKSQLYATQIMMRFGDYAEANKIFISALQHNQTQRLYTQSANCYYWQDSLVLAQLAIEKASLCPSEGRQYDATFAATTAAIQIKLNQLELAEQNALKALALYHGVSDNEQQVIRLHTSLAEIATAQKQYTKAVKHFQEAEKLALGYFKGKSRELAKLYVEYGDACLKLGQNERAMGFYQKAVINAWPEFHQTDIHANPDTVSIPAEEWAIQSLIRKAELLLDSKNPSLSYRLNAAT
jgi:tetratricopeptide (TPR) repeat protein